MEKMQEMTNSNSEMTLTLANRMKAKIEIAAIGNFTIDWDDGANERFIGNGAYCKYIHRYPDNKKRTVRITGDCITGLRANKCSISSVDVTKNEALATLSISANNLTSLDVSKNTALKELICNSNSIKSLDLSNNPALTLLNCESGVRSLDVSKNTMLKELHCSDIRNLDVSKNIALEILYIYDCNNFDIVYHILNKIDPESYLSLDLSNHAALTVLNCRGTKLSSLNVSKNAALEELICTGCRLFSLDVTANTALKILECNSNQLTSLDVNKNTSLTKLDCYQNKLTSLDLTQNTTLTELNCSYNQLTSLDVGKNTTLTELKCYNNQLTSLDVSKNATLTELDCYNNQLTSLDVSKNATLTRLNCSNNQLTSLDVSKNTTLTELSCYDNKLTSLDVSKNTMLTKLCSTIKSRQLARAMKSKSELLMSIIDNSFHAGCNLSVILSKLPEEYRMICSEDDLEWHYSSGVSNTSGDISLCEEVESFRMQFFPQSCRQRPADFFHFFIESIVCGMFVAKLKHHSDETLHSSAEKTFTRSAVANLTPFSFTSNPPKQLPPYWEKPSDSFFNELFQYIAGDDLHESIRPVVDDLADILNNADINAISREFTEEENAPVIRFVSYYLDGFAPHRKSGWQRMVKSGGSYYSTSIYESLSEIL